MEAGNVKSIREALEALVCVIDKYDSRNPLWWNSGAKGVKPLKDARTALSATPRNCDRFATLDDARNAFFADYVPDETCSSATAFAIWIFDEKKGGAK